MNNEGISRISYNLLPFYLSLFLALSLHSLSRRFDPLEAPIHPYQYGGTLLFGTKTLYGPNPFTKGSIEEDRNKVGR